MKFNKTKNVVIALLLVFNILLMLKIKIAIQDSDDLSFIINQKQNQIAKLRYDTLRLKKNLIFSYFTIRNRFLSQTIDSLPALILRVHSNNCNECVSRSIKILNNFRSKLKYKILVFADYPTEDAVKSQFQFDYPLRMVKMGEIAIDYKSGSEAYYFVLNKSGLINNIFVPEWDMMNLFEKYLNSLKLN